MKRFFLFLFALLLCTTALAEDASTLEETILFDGETTITESWSIGVSVNTSNAGGSFDPSVIGENGYFTVVYEGGEKAVYLALSDWESGTWAQVNVPSACTLENGLYVATFSYEQCFIQYGSKNFAAVDQICVGASTVSHKTVIHQVIWHGEKQADLLGADDVLFSGAATANAQNACPVFCFTRHVGGDFDAAQINPGSRFYVEYEGSQYGVYLALSSHSGATHWTRVNASETVTLADGRYGAYFDYSAFAKAFGTNFARLDQVSVFTTTGNPITVYKLAYFAGEGDPVDASDGRWERPDAGIAFIGDSICQNALLLYGDWNTILGRSDCANYGIGGQTTVECRARIDELASRNYQQVVFICGINDIGHGYTKEEIVKNYDAMISAIQENHPSCQFVILSTLPTTSAYYSGQQGKITLLNLAFRRYANKTENVTFVDAYSSFCPSAGEYAYPELLSDGLHPNADGYAKIAEILKPYLFAEE